jgi:hypothetical protein
MQWEPHPIVSRNASVALNKGHISVKVSLTQTSKSQMHTKQCKLWDLERSA